MGAKELRLTGAGIAVRPRTRDLAVLIRAALATAFGELLFATPLISPGPAAIESRFSHGPYAGKETMR